MTITRPKHAPMPQFPVEAGQLHVGGRNIAAWAEEYGTPLYLYDRNVIAATVATLRKVIPAGIGIHYALKANPYPPLVNFLSPLLDGLDIASVGELEVALAAGANPAHISMAGPGKTDAVLFAALSAGIRINIESAGELIRLAQLAHAAGCRARIALRINPDIELKSAGMRMGGGATPFGIDAEQAPALLMQLGDLPVDFEGFHFYAGSQILRADVIVAMQRHCFELAVRLATEAGLQVRSLNLGGGFGIPYFPGETRLDLAPIAAGLQDISKQAREIWPGVQIDLELGRYLVGEAGLYVTRIVDRKTSRGKTYLITDGGMNHHLAASGNLGQVLRKNYPVAIGNRIDTGIEETVSIVGPLCTPLDLLADNVALPQAVPNDLVVIFQSGAYGYSASPNGFLSHPLPREILL